MRKTGWLSLVLCCLLAVSMAIPAMAEAPARASMAFEGEAPHLTMGFINSDYGPDKRNWPSDTFNYVRDYMNVDLEFIGWPDEQQFQIALAGADLPDVVQIQNHYIRQILEAGLIVPMDDYLDHAPNMVNLSKLREAAMRQYCSNGDGKWYFWTPQIGMEAPGSEMWNGFTVRWDIYKDMGAPEIKNDQDYLNFLKAAVDAYPTTEDGKPVYGYATYNDLWGWWVPGSFYGYHNVTDAYHLRATDSQIINAYVDQEGPIWKQVDFCFRANQLGIFDPDSFTMKADDLKAKIANEQYIGIICEWYDSLYDLKRQEDPNTLSRYMTLPIEGQTNWTNNDVKVGWSFYYGITTNCQDPTVAMRMFDFLNSEEGARVCRTGPQGKIWDYVDGKPVVLQDAIDKKATMTSDEWAVWGSGLWDGMIGVGNAVDLADGGKADLWRSTEIMKASLNPAQIDFASFYGVELPRDAALKLIDEGKAADKRTVMFDLTGLLPSPPQNISRIDNNCREIMMRALPKLVLAADRATYEAERDAVLAEFAEAGVNESIEWWESQAEPVREFILANS